LPGGIGWYALASAHEVLATDAAGQQRFLGYVIQFGGLRIYHSGDCVPYPGLAAELRRHAVHVAILPVNGRDAVRSAAGIPGNFTFDEAVELCRQAGIDSLLPCHFGMFDFNTVDEAWLDRRIAALAGPPQCVRPHIGAAYECGIGFQPVREAWSLDRLEACPTMAASPELPALRRQRS
jgi:L-ascorbate metabolism protein UlaG (beta-lactamase superfamily)